MKDQWLYYAIFAILCALTSHLFWTIPLVILGGLWSWHSKKVHLIPFILFIIVTCFYFNLPRGSDSTTSIGQVIEIHDRYLLVRFDRSPVIVYTDEKVALEANIKITGEFDQIEDVSNFYSFNFSLWCQRRGITQSISPKSLTKLSDGSMLRNYFYNQTMKIKDIKLREASLKFVFGLNKNKDDFYLIYSSGVHLILLVHFFQSVVERKKRNQINIFLLIFLFLYQYFIHSSFALLRMLLVLIIQVFFDKSSRKDQLGLNILTCLFAFPYCPYELGFLIPISFSLVSVFTTRPLSQIVKQTLILLPLQLFVFAQCNLFSLITFRFFRIFYCLGFVLAHLTILLPITGFLFHLYLLSMPLFEFFHRITFNFLGKPSILWMIIFVYYLFQTLSRVKKADQLILVSLILFMLFKPYLDPISHVYFINVKQGDSCLILLPFNQGVMFIDVAGSLFRNIPKDSIKPYLDAHGLRWVDLVVLTHDDYDHAGGLKELEAIIPIKHVISDKSEEVKLGKIMFESILNDVSFDNSNDDSIVLAFTLGGLNYLFMGDASLAYEKEFLKKYISYPIDVLKVGHHGSKTSTSPAFIQATAPQLAIISVALKNGYHHPSSEVLKTLDNFQIKTLLTSMNGAVHIQSLFNFNLVTTSHSEFGIIDTR